METWGSDLMLVVGEAVRAEEWRVQRVVLGHSWCERPDSGSMVERIGVSKQTKDTRDERATDGLREFKASYRCAL